MFSSEPRHSETEPRLVVRDGIAATQWEICWSEEHPNSRQTWLTPPLIAYRAWRREVWDRETFDAGQPALLRHHQSAALWRTIVRNSPAGQGLLNIGASARWAAQARQLLADWRIDTAILHDDTSHTDYQALVAWTRNYTEWLADHHWRDEPNTLDTLTASEQIVPRALTLVDLYDLTPAQQSLLAALKQSGWSIEHSLPAAVAGHGCRARLPDAKQELAAASHWACERVNRDPHSRTALVVPNLRGHLAEAGRGLLDTARTVGLTDAENRIGLQYQAALHTKPLIGAALDGIELLSSLGTFVTLSRWLRSSFFHADMLKRARAAVLESTLRAQMLAQLPFLIAYDRGGLRQQLERDAPDLAMPLAAGLREVRTAAPTNSPTQWAQIWSRMLQWLGWPGPTVAPDDPALSGWDNALARFAQLTPILGSIPLVAAVTELKALLDSQTASASLPRYGVHVFDHIDAVGPGYGAVWVTGLTDQQWPERGRPNPLLPRKLQRLHGMPWSTPQDAIGRAQASTARLLSRVEEVIFSWPASVHEYSAEPSPVITGFELIGDIDRKIGLARLKPVTRPRALEQVAEAAPSYDERHIEGGARTLNLQARCPVRAFCENRLRAVALEPPARGLGARGQGIALHDALEFFLRKHPSQESLPADSASARTAIRGSAARALAKAFGAVRNTLPRLYELECARIETLLEAWLEAERQRPPFRVAKLEERTEIEIAGKTISSRIDRIDELADGSLALIDYKTGKAVAGIAAWFGDRLVETQLPLYALQLGPSLSTMVMVLLANRSVAFRGVTMAPDQFAKALRPIPDGRRWEEQLDIWRAQIQQLIREYASGDVRIFPDDCADAQGAFAPLTRVYACLSDFPGDDET